MNFINIIINYIQNPDYDGAIMINGDWGRVKSHYWTNTIKPELEKIKNEKTAKKYKCLYVSLNGLKDPLDIFSQLAIEKYPIVKSKAFKLTGSASSLLLNFSSHLPLISRFIYSNIDAD